MKCLQEDCDKELENKSGRQKFCSNSCKMKYFRKHGKKESITKIQLTGILNEVRAAIQEFKDLATQNNIPVKYAPITPESYDGKKMDKVIYDEFPKYASPSKTFEQYKQAKLECENVEDWEKLEQEILNSDLSQKQKTLLTKYN
jgi:hypothetical protein